MKKATRRDFLKLGAVAAGGAVAARSMKGLPLSHMRSDKATVAVNPALSVLGYEQVELLDGPFRFPAAAGFATRRHRQRTRPGTRASNARQRPAALHGDTPRD